jgi:hypothetical protein
MTTPGFEVAATAEVAAEIDPHAELLKLSAAIDGLALEMDGQPQGDPDRTIRVFFNEADIWAALEANGSSLYGVSEVLAALERLDASRDDGDPWAMRIISSVNDKYFIGSLQALAVGAHPNLYAVLERAVGEESASLTAEAGLMNTVEQIMRYRYGTMARWKMKAQHQTLPPFMLRLMERPYFARACLESEMRQIEARPEKDLQAGTARAAEWYILDSLGVSFDRVFEYQIAIEERTLLRGEDNRVLAFNKGGGLDLEAWHTAMAWFIDNYNYLGKKRVETLRKDWGIINLDRYGPGQLERMCRLSEGDPVLLEHLRSNDVTLLVTDRFGDSPDTASDDIRLFENNDDTLLFTEVGTPAGFYLPPVRLAKRFGIKPSTIWVALHGVGGTNYVGVVGRKASPGAFFEVGVTDYADPADRYDVDNFFDLRDTQIARLLRDYMKPGRQIGQRLVGLLACYQAKRMPEVKASTAETLAWLADVGDKVVVAAHTGELGWNRQTERLWSSADNAPAIFYFFQRVSEAAIRLTLGQLPLDTK